eukprot:gene2239-1401_t
MPEYKALLLEGVNPLAKLLLEAQGCTVELLPNSPPRDELLEMVKDVHLLGVRSKTNVDKELLSAAPKLMAIGCFCIGTNQVDLEEAKLRGVAVFNSPFANTRSVAELALGEIICLSRKLTQRSEEVHQGRWEKTHIGCYEVRGKTLGIIGYGHIGSQVGVLAEGLGMRVLFHDVLPKMSIGNAHKMSSMADLLRQSDFVTLHVPELPSTVNLIGPRELSLMKRGAYLINLSRGTVVDLDALASALRNGDLGGAGVDVYPTEPGSKGDVHRTPLQGLPNVILTPHVGGSTCEAQAAIGEEVGHALAQYVSTGCTAGSVNMPVVAPPPLLFGSHRIINTHHNVAGSLSAITKIVAELGCNITFQYLNTDPVVGYLVMDVDKDEAAELQRRIADLETTYLDLYLYHHHHICRLISLKFRELQEIIAYDISHLTAPFMLVPLALTCNLGQEPYTLIRKASLIGVGEKGKKGKIAHIHICTQTMTQKNDNFSAHKALFISRCLRGLQTKQTHLSRMRSAAHSAIRAFSFHGKYSAEEQGKHPLLTKQRDTAKYACSGMRPEEVRCAPSWRATNTLFTLICLSQELSTGAESVQPSCSTYPSIPSRLTPSSSPPSIVLDCDSLPPPLIIIIIIIILNFLISEIEEAQI